MSVFQKRQDSGLTTLQVDGGYSSYRVVDQVKLAAHMILSLTHLHTSPSLSLSLEMQCDNWVLGQVYPVILLISS